MSDTQYLKLNTSINTGSNASTLERNSDGDVKAVIELRLPDSLSREEDIQSIDLQVSKMRLSLNNLPIALVPINPQTIRYQFEHHEPITTLMWIGFWAYFVADDGSILPHNEPLAKLTYPNSNIVPIRLPLTFETFDIDFAERTGTLPLKRYETLMYALETALNELHSLLHSSTYPVTRHTLECEVNLTADTFSIDYRVVDFFSTSNEFLFGTPGIYTQGVTSPASYSSLPAVRKAMNISSSSEQDRFPETGEGGKFLYVSWGINIIGNSYLKNLLNFLPWLTSPKRFSDLLVFQRPRTFGGASYNDSDLFYILNSVSASAEQYWSPSYAKQAISQSYAYKYLNVLYTWRNVPTILLSPVSSVVLLLDGIGVNPQILPVNMKQKQGSSLTTSIPVIENYFPLVTSIRDLHDDLVIHRDAFANTALFSIPANSITERTLRFRAGYITKDGQLFDLFISPTGTFSIQLTLALHTNTTEPDKKRIRF